MRLAVLTAQLPATSRVAVAEHPENAWESGDYLLRLIEHDLRGLIWSLGGGSKSGHEEPSPVPAPGEAERRAAAIEEAERRAAAIARRFGL